MIVKRTSVFPIRRRFAGLRSFKAVKPPDHAFQGIRLVNMGSFKAAAKNHALLIFLALFLLLGVVSGALVARAADAALLARLDFLLYCDHSTRISQAPAAIFSASLGSAFFFIFACFLFGLSAWGMIAIPLIPLFRGYGLGLASGFLYAAHGFSGVVFNLVVILPGAFLCVLSVLYAAKEGICFSKKIAQRVFGAGKDDGSQLLFKNYFSRFGSIMILAAASSVVDLITTFCFSGAFSF